jgi:hypothetical protein
LKKIEVTVTEDEANKVEALFEKTELVYLSSSARCLTDCYPVS